MTRVARWAPLLLLGCLQPTQVTFDISTDIPCAQVAGTSITVGIEGETEKADPLKIVTDCAANGTVSAIGSYAVKPRVLSMPVVASFKVAIGVDGANVSRDCTASNGYRGCIVARRRVSFIAHRSMHVPVALYRVCKDVQCDQNTTCNSGGRCNTSLIDSEQCSANDVCDQFTPTANAGMPCFNTPAAEQLFCSNALSWCTRDALGQRACATAPVNGGTSFQCRTSRDCGPALFCVAHTDAGILGQCEPYPDSTALLLCTPEDVAASCPPGLRSCSSDAGSGLLSCAPDAGQLSPDAGTADAGMGDAGDDAGAPVDAGPGPWQQSTYFKASNAEVADGFGTATALSADGQWLVVGAPNEDSNASGIDGSQTDNSMSSAGAVYVFRKNAGVWVQQAYLKASNPDTNDQFGNAVAVSGDGSVIAVGAWNEASTATGVNGDQFNNNLTNAGAVYVFERTGQTWAQTAYVKAHNTVADGASGDRFGETVAISTDGRTMAVGAESEDSANGGVNADDSDNSAAAAGAAWVFVKTGATWAQQAYLKAFNAGVDDRFGISLAMDSSGDVLLVGAQREASSAHTVNGNGADNSAPQTGAAYVFRRNAGAWSQEAYLKSFNGDASDRFGCSVAVSADGTAVVVGALFEDGSARTVNGIDDNGALYAGAAYIFRNNAGVWQQEAYLKAANGEVNDELGSSVGINGDGSVVFVGARYESSNSQGIDLDPNNNAFATSGAVYSFEKTGGLWAQTHYFKSSNSQPNDQFCGAMRVSADARTLICGTPNESSVGIGVNGVQIPVNSALSGAVYLFSR